MVLAKLLARQKANIVKAWFDRLINSYPPDTAQFLKSQKDQFANPVGFTAQESMQGLFDLMLEKWDRPALIKNLDPIIRVRAIQNFSPSQAVSFILDLKPLVRSQVDQASVSAEELARFDQRVDDLLLLAFDIYLQCREKIYELKVSTERDKIYSAFSRAGRIADVSKE